MVDGHLLRVLKVYYTGFSLYKWQWWRKNGVHQTIFQKDKVLLKKHYKQCSTADKCPPLPMFPYDDEGSILMPHLRGVIDAKFNT